MGGISTLCYSTAFGIFWKLSWLVWALISVPVSLVKLLLKELFLLYFSVTPKVISPQLGMGVADCKLIKGKWPEKILEKFLWEKYSKKIKQIFQSWIQIIIGEDLIVTFLLPMHGWKSIVFVSNF